MRIDEAFEPMINSNAGEGEIEKFSREHGMVLLQEDGILRVLAGITSFEEVEAVTGPIGWGRDGS
jgi:type II secretory ATPase GspE/PulE/Tfp pilus assembly ATPase PilB-like protein